MKTTAQGKWSAGEHRLFLKGCIEFGWGHWKDIAETIPTRSVSQVKSHAQKVSIHRPGEKKRLQLEHARKKVADGDSHPDLQDIPTKLNMLCAAVDSSPKVKLESEANEKANFHPLLNMKSVQLSHLHASVPTKRKGTYLRRVSDDSNSIVPSKFDVICALGEAYSIQHPGNRQFQVTVEMNLPRFQAADNEKRDLVIEDVLNGIKSSGGRFVQRRDSGTWKTASDAFARKKILTSFVSFMEVRSMS